MTEREIFLAVLDLPDQAARSQYLDEVCGDPAQRARLESLLRSHDTAGSFLGNAAVAPPQPNMWRTQELGSETTPEENEADSALDFLQPSTRPDSLGRLGHYDVLQVLGRGGFGIVFRAFDEVLQRVVAVKVLAPQMAATSPARKRFLREARFSAKVRHENVVQVHAVEEQPLPYLVMEFIPGETLQQRLDRTGPLETVEVMQIGRQIAEGLAAAHGTGLIHRDIKPANILIEDSPNQHVKITDFGLARAADDANLSQSGVIAGTPMFMSPEQAHGDKLDHRADLFSLGSVLYMMCSGRPPFRANNTLAVLKRVAEDTPRPIPEIIPEVSPWLCDLIARLHAKKPADRIGTAREVADLLGRGLEALQHAVNFPPLPVASPAAVAEAPREDMASVGTMKLPGPAPAARPRFRARRWAAAAAMLLTLVGGLGFTEATGVTNVRSTVIRLFSPERTLVVEVDDPGVGVKVDGSEIVITGAGVQEIRLKPGRGTGAASKDSKIGSQDLLTVTKNGKQTVRVSQEARKDDPDRRAAEYMLSLGVGAEVSVNEQTQKITAAADLPREAFRLTGVWGTPQATDAVLAIFKDCQNVTWLHLHDNTEVSDAGLAHFKGCTNMTYLDLSNAKKIGDAGLAHFKDCKGLRDAYLYRTKVTDAGLAHFKDYPELTSVLLDHTKVTDAGLAHLKDCQKLHVLSLEDTKVTDAGLAHLVGLDKLTSLQLSKTKVTAKGVETLAKTLPKCKIEWDGGVIQPQ